MTAEETFTRTALDQQLSKGVEERFKRTTEEIFFGRYWGFSNWDNYNLIFSPEKVSAKANHNFDDNWSDYGDTFWRAEIPRNLVQRCLDSFEKTGKGELEYKTIVSKFVSWNGWHSEEEKYPYKVKVELEKDETGKINGGARLMIHFQDSMEVYF